MTEIVLHVNVLTSLRFLIAPCCGCNGNFEVGKQNVSIPYVEAIDIGSWRDMFRKTLAAMHWTWQQLSSSPC
jgi:hypothetical protein